MMIHLRREHGKKIEDIIIKNVKNLFRLIK